MLILNKFCNTQPKALSLRVTVSFFLLTLKKQGNDLL